MKNKKIVISELDSCPECNKSFNRRDILEHFLEAKNNPKHPQHSYYKNKSIESIEETASLYGYTKEKPKYFSDVIGIKYQGVYDGILAWQCPHCNTTWGRFSGNKNPIIKEENFYLNSKKNK